MGQALYRSYRSKTFDEVVGQEHITTTLAAALKAGRISHAYLFTGPRGVGKTSVARILAREVNKLPYGGEDIHLDIIEIDAASNRRIDEIRDLRDKVHISPSSAKYKVYIIDEVHMLTREAFNALLKTLEEPPAHVIFILATTEAHKLPETIISRTQRFNFKTIEPAKAAAHLETIAKKEKIKADKDALELIARYGEGSFRDSISLLDQLASSGLPVTKELVESHLGLPKDQTVAELLEAVANKDGAKILSVLDSLRQEAADSITIAKALAAKIRQAVNGGNYHQSDLKLLRELLEVPANPQPDELLEILLLEASAGGQEPKAQVKIEREIEPAAPKSKPQDKKPGPPIKTEFQNFDLSMWEEVLTRVKSQAASIYTALRLGQPEMNDGVLTLYFEFPLHQKKINQAQAKGIIGDVIEQICGDKVVINCLLDKEIFKAKQDDQPADFYTPPQSEENLQAISNIFGSAEMLES
jgi:DNA polymerase-3 subunit gamma/tau